MAYLQVEQNRNSYQLETPQNEGSVYTPENYSRSPQGQRVESMDAMETSDERYELHPPVEQSTGRPVSTSSARGEATGVPPSKNEVAKKKASIKPIGNLSRRSSKRSVRAGSLKGLPDNLDEGFNNVFRIPIPTSGNPTEALANRFQAWRKFLRDLIAYFREVQISYDNRAKALVKVSGAIQTLSAPRDFLLEGGIGDAIGTLRGFSKAAVTEANRARDIEEDVITQLNGLRNDLTQKMKEIKSLSGDFKNSVDKEKETTKRAVDHLRHALALSQTNPSAASGKGDPYIARLAVERQVEKQIDEENYLHRAYLNLEGSGRELEAIVVGEIQKAFNAYAGILKREYDHALEAVDLLRNGPIAMSKDHEWESFVQGNPNFINPSLPLRKVENIFYPGKFAPAAAEIRGGTLERKSKYLKSYTPGWYILSATHIHEFKSADHLHTQTPVMSLCLAEQKLGSHSQLGASSHKFNLKGRQTGSMHRGHSWVFRAESYDTMMAWYDDIKSLVEKTGEDKVAFMRKHIRLTSGSSYGGTSIMSGDGLGDDDADKIPFAATSTMPPAIPEEPPQQRAEPGGHFATGLTVGPDLKPPQTTSAASSVYGPRDSMVGESATTQHPQQSVVMPRDDDLDRGLYSPSGPPNRTYLNQGVYGTLTRPSHEENVEPLQDLTVNQIGPQAAYHVPSQPSNVYPSLANIAQDVPRPYDPAPLSSNPYTAPTFAAIDNAHQYVAVSRPPPTQPEYRYQSQSHWLPQGLSMPATLNSLQPMVPIPQLAGLSHGEEGSHEQASNETGMDTEGVKPHKPYETHDSTTIAAQDVSQSRTPSDDAQATSHQHEFSHEPAPHEQASIYAPVRLDEPLNYNPPQAQVNIPQEQSHDLPASHPPPIQATSSGSYLNGSSDMYHDEVGPTESAPGVFINKLSPNFSNHETTQEEPKTTTFDEPATLIGKSYIKPFSHGNGDAFSEDSRLGQPNGALAPSAPSVSSTSDTDATSVIHLVPTPGTEVYVGAPSLGPPSETDKEFRLHTPQADHPTQRQDFEEPVPRTSRFTEVGMAGMQSGRWNGAASKNGASSVPTPHPELRHMNTAVTVSDLPVPGKYNPRG